MILQACPVRSAGGSSETAVICFQLWIKTGRRAGRPAAGWEQIWPSSTAGTNRWGRWSLWSSGQNTRKFITLCDWWNFAKLCLHQSCLLSTLTGVYRRVTDIRHLDRSDRQSHRGDLDVGGRDSDQNNVSFTWQSETMKTENHQARRNKTCVCAVKNMCVLCCASGSGGIRSPTTSGTRTA